MEAELIRDALRRRPFEPFRIYLSDGRSFLVRHPEMVMVGRRAIILGLPSGHQPETADPFDVVETIALIHITSLQTSTQAAG